MFLVTRIPEKPTQTPLQTRLGAGDQQGPLHPPAAHFSGRTWGGFLGILDLLLLRQEALNSFSWGFDFFHLSCSLKKSPQGGSKG